MKYVQIDRKEQFLIKYLISFSKNYSSINLIIKYENIYFIEIGDRKNHTLEIILRES